MMRRRHSIRPRWTMTRSCAVLVLGALACASSPPPTELQSAFERPAAKALPSPTREARAEAMRRVSDALEALATAEQRLTLGDLAPGVESLREARRGVAEARNLLSGDDTATESQGGDRTWVTRQVRAVEIDLQHLDESTLERLLPYRPSNATRVRVDLVELDRRLARATSAEPTTALSEVYLATTKSIGFVIQSGGQERARANGSGASRTRA